MLFLSLLSALLLEQFAPLPKRNIIYRSIASWMRWAERMFFAGKTAHAQLVWAMAVLLPSAVVLLISLFLLMYGGNLLSLIFNVMVLYTALGFGQSSKTFSSLQKMLEQRQEPVARRMLALWLRVPTQEWPRDEMVTLVMQQALRMAHVHIFGVLTAYVIFSILGLGPVGAVLYRLAEVAFRLYCRPVHGDVDLDLDPAFEYEFAANSANSSTSDAPGGSPAPATLDAAAYPQTQLALGEDSAAQSPLPLFTYQAWERINWLPARLSVVAFAMVGSFEDTISVWRYFSKSALQATLGAGYKAMGRSLNPSDALVITAAAGALNVHYYGSPARTYSPQGQSSTETTTEQLAVHASAEQIEASQSVQIGHLQHTATLVWRALVLFLLLIAFTEMAHLWAIFSYRPTF